MVKEELTEMQKRFCDYYIESPVGVHAAIRAGYKEHSARTRASQLLAMPKVQDYIIERNSDLEDIRIADMKEVRMFWTRVMRDEEEETSERLRASDFIAKSNGAYLDSAELNEARIEQVRANAEYTKEKTKLIKGDIKDTSILDALIELEGSLDG